MIKKLLVAGVILIIFGGLFSIANSWLYQLACEGQLINYRLYPTEAQQIWGERIIAQSFVAPRNYLNRIDLLFQTYGRQNTHDVTVGLLELPPNAANPLQGVLLQSFTFNAATVKNYAWHTFTFAPIPNSAGKTYLIAIQSPQSTPGNAITVGGIEWDTYAPGSAFLGPVPARADIAFRSCYQMTTAEKLQTLADQITRNRPGLWGNPAFYGVILILYGLLLIGFFWKLVKLI